MTRMNSVLRDPIQLWHSIILSLACWGNYLRHSKNLDLCKWLKVMSALQGCAYPLSDHNLESSCGGTMNECSLWRRSPLKRTLNSKAAWWSWKALCFVSTQVLTRDRSSDRLREAHSRFHTHDSQQVLESRWVEEQSFEPKGPFCIPLPQYSPLVVPELPMMASICPLLTLKLRFWMPGSQESLWDVQGILNWASCSNQSNWEATSTWEETLAGSSESQMAQGLQ